MESVAEPNARMCASKLLAVRLLGYRQIMLYSATFPVTVKAFKEKFLR